MTLNFDGKSLEELRLLRALPNMGEHAIAQIDALLDERDGVAAEPVKRDAPNKTEAQWLAIMRAENPGAVVSFHAIKVRLADGAWFTSDVLTVFPDGQIILDDTKGFQREAARVRVRVAARTYPWIQFRVVKKRKVKDGGGWKIEWLPRGEV